MATPNGPDTPIVVMALIPTAAAAPEAAALPREVAGRSNAVPGPSMVAIAILPNVERASSGDSRTRVGAHADNTTNANRCMASDRRARRRTERGLAADLRNDVARWRPAAETWS